MGNSLIQRAAHGVPRVGDTQFRESDHRHAGAEKENDEGANYVRNFNVRAQGIELAWQASCERAGGMCMGKVEACSHDAEGRTRLCWWMCSVARRDV
ncbi:hypothetical protein CRG98_034536 [Punica granatum]|uniref:Uncharacterized protein n=1 Tax=Punica granatum TaxID=22663 RepID=A0A2I0IM33_PUNGR|nr:hypothetical protein CRG98_034536 [Punica granatum]